MFHGLYDPGADTPVYRYARALQLEQLAQPPDYGFYLTEQDSRLTLCRAGVPTSRGLYVDFNAADINRRIAAGRRSLLARALGLHKRPGVHVLDATCGMGRDSAVLAGLGCQLQAVERHPALHALLADGLRRLAHNKPAWHDNWQALHHANASQWLGSATTGPAFDVIYIDPMFDNTRRKARPQRALQWLGELIGPDEDAAALLSRARDRARRRVVVKSHSRAEPLARPDHQLGGKGVRFDVYFSASKSAR